MFSGFRGRVRFAYMLMRHQMFVLVALAMSGAALVSRADVMFGDGVNRMATRVLMHPMVMHEIMHQHREIGGQEIGRQ